jgi:hypothetical protein
VADGFSTIGDDAAIVPGRKLPENLHAHLVSREADSPLEHEQIIPPGCFAVSGTFVPLIAPPRGRLVIRTPGRKPLVRLVVHLQRHADLPKTGPSTDSSR